MEKSGNMNDMTTISEATRQRLLEFQRTEITEHHLYRRLAQRVRAPNNRETLEKIAADELAHYQTWRKYTGQDVAPDWGRVRRYELISRLMGFTFGVELMERNEVDAQDCYAQLKGEIPEEDLDEIIRQEYEHEDALLALLDEERLRYTGSIVLGLNDALVELTGALAGLTLALQNTRLIASWGSSPALPPHSPWRPRNTCPPRRRRLASSPCAPPSTPASPTSPPSWCWSCPTCCWRATSTPWA